MADQRSGNEVCALKQAGIDCEFRQQGGAETVVDHLHQCWKACRFEALGETPVRKTAAVTKAVTVLQQQQVLAQQALGLNARLLGKRVLARSKRRVVLTARRRARDDTGRPHQRYRDSRSDHDDKMPNGRRYARRSNADEFCRLSIVARWRR
jgi:hypothetical protein